MTTETPRLLAGVLLAGLLIAGARTAAQDAASPGRATDEADAPTATLPEAVVVTGTRSPRPTSALPVTVEVLERAAIRESPATTPDALLRASPSFQTFRRTTSLVADPSSQGLALRGIGPSAVARTLLLDDGAPATDPFGGWIAWRALPRLGLDRVEVAPGGASALYGNFALGGVVAFVPRAIPEGATLEAEASGGSFGTASGAVWMAGRSGPLAAALEADALATDGYRLVAPGDAGPVDGLADADHARGTLRLVWQATPRLEVRVGAGTFTERQDGGTEFTTSALSAHTGRVGLAWTLEAVRVEALAFGALRRFDQDRARIPEGRATETLASRQRIPSTDAGLSLVVSAAPGGHALAAGGDVRRVSGEADETLYPATPDPAAATDRDAEGAQVFGGVFAEDRWRVRDGLELAGALRLDAWRNAEARTSQAAQDGAVRVERYAARTATELSPRLAVLWRPVPAVVLRASAYRAFRAPTLSELFRTFQVGTVVTAPNPALEAERLVGAEAGPEVMLGALRLRATGFWNVLEAPATVVTLDAPLPGGATRQRQNLGEARVRGVEARAAWEREGLAVALGWTLSDARITSARDHADLVGKRLAQDPLHRLVAEVRGGTARVRGGLAVRWSSEVWDDDRNTLRLAPYALVDVDLSVRLGPGLEAYAAVENLLDRDYLVGRAGVDTVGAPRLVRGGVRVRASSR